ncbi:MAG: class I SAM-dependent methyltransferase [Alphaproteobacteria bacterium]|jgi:predicted O-methyltransferase YrrM|nr:class I SAM-dependent methyltransferase [Alphaproteobacteria bacterium]MDP6589824.1 class I SAM-dependent methyltransferase [Alphaproteobacteria bacterium]MDP6817187.1 class I SAM-dependent methyltransferase [Alphaproteobacteria bacterium]|tara:strand:+ start:210 stop:878 length:669 start_codon:yes stop_codon:yes gene_type:complete
MANRPTELTLALHDYLLAHGFREAEILARLRQETQSHERAIMQITPEQGAFMGLLAELIGCRRYLEIGVFTGYSSLVLALAMGAGGHVTALDRNAEYTEIAERYWREAGLAENIELRLGDASDSLAQLLAEGRAGSYDFAFIDADKTGYDGYYEACLELLRPGGLLALDNMFHLGRVAPREKWAEETPAIDALNAKVKDDERVNIAMIPIGDGLTLCRKRPQ